MKVTDTIIHLKNLFLLNSNTVCFYKKDHRKWGDIFLSLIDRILVVLQLPMSYLYDMAKHPSHDISLYLYQSLTRGYGYYEARGYHDMTLVSFEEDAALYQKHVQAYFDSVYRFRTSSWDNKADANAIDEVLRPLAGKFIYNDDNASVDAYVHYPLDIFVYMTCMYYTTPFRKGVV